MKKNLNIIQINGVKGLVMMGLVGCCLAAGFAVFPGWVAMHIWNFAANYTLQMPAIGILQGMLLWGILVASYFIFRKERLVVCMHAPQELSDEELKKVFAEMKKDAEGDTVLQAMLKAREAELKLQDKPENLPNEKTEEPVNKQ